jgi:PilZ domain
MGATNQNATSPARRWPRHQVSLPVRIATGDGTSTIDGLATEISRGGMAIYGGVPLEPGDLMAVEFPTSSPVCVAGIIRNRSGFCFGLEFLSLVMSDPAASCELKPEVLDSQQNLPALTRVVASRAAQDNVIEPEEKLVAAFLHKHADYLRNKDQEVDRMREKAMKVRQLRYEIQDLFHGLSRRESRR